MRTQTMHNPILKPFEMIALFIIGWVWNIANDILRYLHIPLPTLGNINGFGITLGNGILQGAGAMLGGLILKLAWKNITSWWLRQKSKKQIDE